MRQQLTTNLGGPVANAGGLAAWRASVSVTGVVSFAQCPDDMLMWGYYAEGHQGYCLELSTGLDPMTFSMPVTYSDERPVFRPFKHKDAYVKMMRALVQKAECWQHESEYRIIRPRNVGIMNVAPDALTSIVLGASIKPDDEAELREMVKGREHPVKFKRASLDQKTYRLSVVEA